VVLVEMLAGRVVAMVVVEMLAAWVIGRLAWIGALLRMAARLMHCRIAVVAAPVLLLGRWRLTLGGRLAGSMRRLVIMAARVVAVLRRWL
jgi:hypothetical protein